MTDKNIPLNQVFWDWMNATIEPEGFRLGHGMIKTQTGELIVLALDLELHQSYQTMILSALKEGASEAIFAIDRYTLPGQSTKYGDLLAGHYYANGAWRPFIIEYRYEPRAFEPIDYTNMCWTEFLNREMAASLEFLQKGVVDAVH